MIGAGTWADKQCALSGTGVGEEFIRRAAAHDVAARVKYKGCSLKQAMKEVVWESFAEGDGGFVGVSADYTAVWDFNRWAELCDLQSLLWVSAYCTQRCETAFITTMECCSTCLYSVLHPLSGVAPLGHASDNHRVQAHKRTVPFAFGQLKACEQLSHSMFTFAIVSGHGL